MEQIYGDFKAGEAILSSVSCTHLGIQAKPGTVVMINDKPFQISLTGLLEFFGEMDVVSLKFNKDVQNVIIEYT